ncbi:MAG TPA: hypothetical protein VFE92_06920 [Dermatophilaceae bacterium]|nr:hypothetical protein [Dermatophilaceae bacterium]
MPGQRAACCSAVISPDGSARTTPRATSPAYMIARKAVTRGDTALVAGCLFRVVEVCAQALHGHAEHWLINEKDAVASVGRLQEAPAGFAVRAQDVLAQLGATPSELSIAIDSAYDLLADTINACKPSR